MFCYRITSKLGQTSIVNSSDIGSRKGVIQVGKGNHMPLLISCLFCVFNHLLSPAFVVSILVQTKSSFRILTSSSPNFCVDGKRRKLFFHLWTLATQAIFYSVWLSLACLERLLVQKVWFYSMYCMVQNFTTVNTGKYISVKGYNLCPIIKLLHYLLC